MGKTIVTNIRQNKRLLIGVGLLLVASFLLELALFNISSWKTITSDEVLLATDAMTDDTGVFRSEDITIDDYVKNVDVSLALINCESASVTVTLTDEGDEYAYDMASYRVVQQVASTGYSNIYPYGKVHTMHVTVSVPEGSGAYIDTIKANVRRPFAINLLRVLCVWAVAILIYLTWRYNLFSDIRCVSKCRWQQVIILIAVVGLIVMGKWMSTSNNRVVECPWPHHKQYQELAKALDAGTVKLLDKEVPQELLDKANPYDTIALTAEGIFYNMDYAYYEGDYYVYFGIVPELLMYYPHYKLTGNDLPNATAAFYMWVILVIGVFTAIWQLQMYLTRESKEGGIPFLTYMLLGVSVALLSNHIYMVGRADIYNIPIIGATAFTYMGIGLWLLGLNMMSQDSEAKRTKVCSIIAIAAGSLSMALVVGCRPQFALYSVIAIILFLVRKDRAVFKKGKIAETIAFVVPYILVAVVVCWYNYARFGNIFDFGATYSLTTNDMNHRGFNLDRVCRGLFSFLFQPAVLGSDFPYITSSIVESNYMGKGLVEFTYGGVFLTNVMTLAVFAPLFGLWKKMGTQARLIFTGMLVMGLVIAGFDVNGAGVIYRYTCDMMPGIIVAAITVWITILGSLRLKSSNEGIVIMETDSVNGGGSDAVSTDRIAIRLFTVAILIGAIYAFLVFVSADGSIVLKDSSVILYEHIRELFRI